MTQEAAYDKLPYESHAIKQTHPKRLFAIATFYGLTPTPLAKAKVLELACASGGNIIPMAFHLPTIQFLGIDLSHRQIQAGTKQITDLRLRNITLRHQSILDFKDKEKFDYIICHGLYSWVEPSVRERVLQICRDNLSTNGVAYISYNTYPGWYMGTAVRDMMIWHTQQIGNLEEKVVVAKSLLAYIDEKLTGNQSAYGSLLKDEIHLILQHSASQLSHEHLGEVNYPLYFYQFIEQAQRYQLAYLADADIIEKRDNLSVEQMKDFMNNRRFRCSLLCHQKQKINEDVNGHPAVEFDYISELSEKPMVSELARYQAQFSPVVTNCRHENIQLSEIAQALLPHINGSNNLASLIAIIQDEVDNGNLVLVGDHNEEITDPVAKQKTVQDICQSTLALIAQKALLVG